MVLSLIGRFGKKIKKFFMDLIYVNLMYVIVLDVYNILRWSFYM